MWITFIVPIKLCNNNSSWQKKAFHLVLLTYLLLAGVLLCLSKPSWAWIKWTYWVQIYSTFLISPFEIADTHMRNSWGTTGVRETRQIMQAHLSSPYHWPSWISARNRSMFSYNEKDLWNFMYNSITEDWKLTKI